MLSCGHRFCLRRFVRASANSASPARKAMVRAAIGGAPEFADDLPAYAWAIAVAGDVPGGLAALENAPKGPNPAVRIARCLILYSELGGSPEVLEEALRCIDDSVDISDLKECCKENAREIGAVAAFLIASSLWFVDGRSFRRIARASKSAAFRAAARLDSTPQRIATFTRPYRGHALFQTHTRIIKVLPKCVGDPKRFWAASEVCLWAALLERMPRPSSLRGVVHLAPERIAICTTAGKVIVDNAELSPLAAVVHHAA